jgi:CubicO group peptidase (beta-lactamase class C family)
VNVRLLGAILKKVTKIPAQSYLQTKVWEPLGMEFDGLWSTGKRDSLTKTFCCLGATARDYAKFGRLFLNGGRWEGKQIVSTGWYQKNIAHDTSEGSSFNYNYCWHIGLKAYGDFMAIGLYKQHIYINPEKKLIIVTLNNQENLLPAERVNWWYVFRQLADQY